MFCAGVRIGSFEIKANGNPESRGENRAGDALIGWRMALFGRFIRWILIQYSTFEPQDQFKAQQLGTVVSSRSPKWCSIRLPGALWDYWVQLRRWYLEAGERGLQMSGRGIATRS